MNKYIFALERLKEVPIVNTSKYIVKKYKDSLKVLNELVEKEKPKKPDKDFQNVYDIDNGDYIDMQPSILIDVFLCPNCCNEVYRKNKRCNDCGQKLEWSKDD